MGVEGSSQFNDPNALAGFSNDVDYTEQQIGAFLNNEVGLSVVAIERLGQGTDSIVFLINKRWIFKFACRRQAIGLTKAEAYVLARLAKESLPVAVPRIIWSGLFDGQWPYIGYPLIPGRVGYRCDFDAQQRAQTGIVLAKFLRALHAITPTSDDLEALPEDRFGRVPMNDWIDEIESRVNALLRTGIVKEPSDRLTVTSAARGCCLGDRVSLVHRDLTVKNMLFADSLQGVVDWADARMGHPAIDLEIVYLFLPASCRAVFWTHYGEVPSAWRALARLRALYRTGFWISAPEYQTDPAFRKEARQALQFALESRC